MLPLDKALKRLQIVLGEIAVRTNRCACTEQSAQRAPTACLRSLAASVLFPSQLMSREGGPYTDDDCGNQVTPPLLRGNQAGISALSKQVKQWWSRP
jgi:hypothetical protein